MTKESLIKIALVVATNSKCNRAKVGSVIVKDKRIVGTGYNGTPSGDCNDCEDQKVTKPQVIHSEINAILNATTNDLNGAQLYVTLLPCMKCAAYILQKGISEVYYLNTYRDTSSIDYLTKNNVLCKQLFLEQ